MAVASLDTCVVYFGITGGQVYASADAGDSWQAIVHDLPAVLFGVSPNFAMTAQVRVELPAHIAASPGPLIPSSSRSS